ncbi:hypothetical protein BGX31_004161 [Mortierella sp. GBA43]|nr:hypothetical protein BGX31_004161 [Mortierella sp. GBA43]
MQEPMEITSEVTSPIEDRPPAEEHHSVDDVEWMTQRFLPILPGADERACETFQWKIEDWSSLDKRVTGPEFEIGGYKWRILLFPQGNNSECVSVYLDAVDAHGQTETNWHVCAQFALTMSNPSDPTVYIAHSAHHRFVPEESDWGFTRFINTSKLDQPLDSRGIPILDNGFTVITAYVRVYEDPTGVLWHNFVDYDSKAMTGYVGLKNQGATCYMNSLLQSLFFTNYFRRAVFEIPTEEDEPSKSVSLALQRVFYQLATSSNSVGTTELTRSFGWNSLESFMQHDVQEFNRVLQDNLEGKMKGTEAEGAIQQLFVGKMKSYIKCINVDYESSRVENFYGNFMLNPFGWLTYQAMNRTGTNCLFSTDIQLNVKGCKTLKDSFDDYVAVETLDGENKYHAEGHGLQDAKKGVIFETLPPVLHLQLKRFEYDIEHDAMVKINDKHEFPLEMDLAEFVADGEEKEKTGPDGFKYSLHGVLVHSGDLHGGHYFALLKPEKDGKWFRFDDDRVTPATLKEVLDDNYGGGEQPENFAALPLVVRRVMSHKRFTNAYMLVYVRNSSMDEILKPLTKEDIPEHLQRRLDDESAALEARRKERAEALMCFNALVISDEDFKTHDGFDLFSPRPGSGNLFKVRKQDTFLSFKQMVAEKYGISEEEIRLWTLVKRQNETIRTDTPVPESDWKETMEQIKDRYGSRSQTELRFYVEFPEKSIKLNGKIPWVQSGGQQGNIMIFIKYYDPFTSKLEGLGKLHVSKQVKVNEIVGTLNAKKGFPASTHLKLFEEIKPTMIEPIKLKATFQQCELQDGDIIVFQKELSSKESTEVRDLNLRAAVPQHYEYIVNRVIVEFRPKGDQDSSLQTYTIELTKRSTYDQVATALATKLATDPMHIQFTAASYPNGQPKHAIKRSTNMLLHEMLPTGNAQSPAMPNILYYEKLSISIVELESKRLIKVTWLGPTLKDESTHEFLLLKTSSMNAVVEALLQKVKPSPEGLQSLRIFAVMNGKFVREYKATDPISTTNDMLSLYVEEIPKEELELGEDEYLVSCFHFQSDINRMHGIPFKVVVKEGETFAATKARIQARLGINDKEFAKIKFVHCNNRAGRITPLILYKEIKLALTTLTSLAGAIGLA